MVKLKYLLWAAAVSLFAFSCASNEENEDNHKEAHALFRDQQKLLRQYIDSMKNLPDSVDAEALMTRFQEQSLKINMKYPADTDLDLSEGENEALYKMTEKLLILASRIGLSPDSIMAARTDSIAKQNLQE